MMKVVARWALLTPIAYVLPAQLLHADLIAAFDNNGNPIAPGQSPNLPADGHWAFFKNPAVDLFYQIWVVPPPPAPPNTYRVVQRNDVVYDPGDGTKPKITSAKQQGKDAVISYSDNGDTVTIPGNLVLPGAPNPAPVGGQHGMLDGPPDSLTPAEALADTEVFLAEFGHLFPTPLNLSFFQYDFSGTVPLPFTRVRKRFPQSMGSKLPSGSPLCRSPAETPDAL